MKDQFPEVHSMLNRIGYVVLGLVALSIAGCGVRPVKGGTHGMLRIDGEVIGDIQITVHRMDESLIEPIGIGTTNNDGEFELLQPGAQGALWLTPGEYRFTLESIGPPIQFPKDFTKAETTFVKGDVDCRRSRTQPRRDYC